MINTVIQKILFLILGGSDCFQINVVIPYPKSTHLSLDLKCKETTSKSYWITFIKKCSLTILHKSRPNTVIKDKYKEGRTKEEEITYTIRQ